MKEYRWACAAALVLLALAAPAAGQTGDAAADTVRLRFGWAPGSSARIEVRHYRERIAETSDTVRTEMRYRVVVDSQDDDLLIRYDDFTFPGLGSTSLEPDVERLVQQAGSLVPSFVVAADGGFLRIHDIEALKARFDSLMVNAVDRDDVREAMDAVFTTDALTALAAQEWNAIVGMWVDADLEPGEVYEFEEDAPLPIMPGTHVRMISQFSIESRVPCAEGGTALDCVEIQLVSFPDPDAVAEAIAGFMQRFGGVEVAGFGFRDLEIENELSMVVEPGTLRPHRVVITKYMTGTVTAAGESAEVSSLDVKEYVYRWD